MRPCASSSAATTPATSAGAEYFQNGPQRVSSTLAYAPLVVHYQGDGLFDQCGRPFMAEDAFQDEEGSVLAGATAGSALLDDRDLARYADSAESLPRIRRADGCSARFHFVPTPGSDGFIAPGIFSL